MFPKLASLQLLTRPLFYFHSKTPNLDQYHPFPLQSYDVGQRLDRYIKNTAIGWISGQKYLRGKDIFILTNTGTIINQNNYRIQEGDRLMIRKGKDIDQQLIGDKNIDYIQMDPEKVEKTLQEMTIFDNPNISILNKSAGYAVQGGPDPHYNIFSLMASRFKKDMIYISHRLDKPTTGLVLIAKNLQTAQLLGEAFQSRNGIDKYYLAMSEGRQIADKVGSIACQLQWTNKHKARIIQYLAKEGDSQLAITNYLLMKQHQLSDVLWRNLVGMKIVTGRKHQIRCQLSQHLSNPILNDELYSGRKVPALTHAIFLHAFALRISSKSLIEQVFKLGSGQGTVCENEKGLVKMEGGEMRVFGKFPSHWEQHQKAIRNSHLERAMSAIQECVFPKAPKVMRLK